MAYFGEGRNGLWGKRFTEKGHGLRGADRKAPSQKLDKPRGVFGALAHAVHDQYFNTILQDFAPRTKWSLQNSFTSAFKLLEPIPSFKATASFGKFFQF
jgi:hypothetical protein